MFAKKWIQSILRFLLPVRLEKENINVVYEDDIEEFIANLGLLEDFEKGNISCAFCGREITKENLQCILSIEGEIKFCCDDLECHKKALEITKGMRKQI